MATKALGSWTHIGNHHIHVYVLMLGSRKALCFDEVHAIPH
jgi:hypothetical protein